MTSDPILDAKVTRTRRQLDAAVRHIDALRSTVEPAVRNLAEFVATGFPSGTGESSLGSNRVSDPTGAAVARNAPESGLTADKRPQPWPERDEFFRDITKLLGCVRQAEELLDEAEKIAAACSVAWANPKGGPGSDVWCDSCLRIGHRAPRGSERKFGKGVRHCDSCASFVKEYGDLPPIALVDRRAQGHRIYDRDIEDAMRKAKAAS